MRFLHTSDWHLGKTLFEHSLLEDQKIFLSQIVEELKNGEDEKKPYDALIVAGDIYDKAIPAPEAVPMFSEFLREVHDNFPKLQMFFSSGNHDSPTRLSFASGLLHYQNIHIATEGKECDRGILVGDAEKGTAAVVYQIPFLQQGSLYDSENNLLRHQDELVKEACERIRKAHEEYASKKIPAVVTAHIFAVNCNLSGSERSFVGTAEQVEAKNFQGFDYVALGHIHRKQDVAGETVCYSGSPLAYNFGETADKVMFSVTVDGNGVQRREIPFVPLHKVTRIEGKYDDFLGDKFRDHLEDYLELICTDSTVHENPLEILRGKYPNLLSFRVARSEASGQNMALAERKKALENIASEDFGRLFDLFIDDVYRNSPDGRQEEDYEDERKLFVETARETRDAESGK